MRIFDKIIKEIRRPRPKFRIGDKVDHKLTGKIFIVMDIDEEKPGKFVCSISSGVGNMMKVQEPLLKRHYDPIKYT